MDFTYSKLKDVLIDIHSGGTPSTAVKEYWGGPYKWLSSGETGQRFISETIETITERGIKESSTKLAKRGSIVMACAGQGKTRGQTSYLLEDMYVNQSVIVMNPDTEKVHPLYLFYDLSRRYEELRGGSDASSTRGSITTASLKGLPFQYPGIEKQRKIVSILYTYDQLIEVNNKRIKVLEQMAENLYKEWFVRFRFPGHETAEFENGIPKGWVTKTLNDWLVDSFNGGWGEEIETPTTQFVSAVIRGTDIEEVKSANYDGVPVRYHKEKDILTKQLKENDIILELSNGNINNIGRTLFVTKEILSHFDCVMCASFCKTLRLEDKKTAFFVWRYIDYLQNSGLMSFFKNTGANGINNFNFKRFLRMPVSISTFDGHLKIIMKYYDQISIIREQNYNLIKQRNLLLPRLMSGKLEV